MRVDSKLRPIHLKDVIRNDYNQAKLVGNLASRKLNRRSIWLIRWQIWCFIAVISTTKTSILPKIRPMISLRSLPEPMLFLHSLLVQKRNYLIVRGRPSPFLIRIKSHPVKKANISIRRGYWGSPHSIMPQMLLLPKEREVARNLSLAESIGRDKNLCPSWEALVRQMDFSSLYLLIHPRALLILRNERKTIV